MNSLARLMAVMRKEVRQMRRDRITFAMILGIPLMQILLFGYAINTDVRDLRTAVADEADTHLSREFIARVGASQVTRIEARVATIAELEQMLQKGEISIGIAIPRDFDRRVAGHTPAAMNAILAVPTLLVGFPFESFPLLMTPVGPTRLGVPAKVSALILGISSSTLIILARQFSQLRPTL